MHLAVQIFAGLVSLWLAQWLRSTEWRWCSGVGVWEQTKCALRWGFGIITVPWLTYLGITRFLEGLGVPSANVLILTALLVAVTLLGTRAEFTGNVMLDSALLSSLLTGLVFTAVNGVPALIALMNWERVYNWALACVIAAVPVRVALWIREDTHEPQ